MNDLLDQHRIEQHAHLSHFQRAICCGNVLRVEADREDSLVIMLFQARHDSRIVDFSQADRDLELVREAVTQVGVVGVWVETVQVLRV